MTSNAPASTPAAAGPQSGASDRSTHRDWIPAIPRSLQRLFDSVPLVTYPPNELPVRSPAQSDLPTLHVFITPEGAARGSPSYNPSCLKWQTFLRIAAIPHTLTPSTNHASPTGALPFLQPALPLDRLDARQLAPIPSTRLDLYAHRYGTLPTTPATAESATEDSPPPSTTTKTTPDQRHHRHEAYLALLASPIRNAWLYALYLSPPNTALLHALYLAPASRTRAIQSALLHQLRSAARAELAKGPDSTTTSEGGWSIGDNVGTLITQGLAGRRTAIDPEAIYADARRGFEALETLLVTEETGTGRWFFGAERPGLFDATVFSYTHLILSDGYYAPLEGVGWRDGTLRGIVRTCPALVEHAERMLAVYWPEEGGEKAI